MALPIWYGYMVNICRQYPETERRTKTAERENKAVEQAMKDMDEKQLALLRRCLIGGYAPVRATGAELGIDGTTAERWQKIFVLTVAKYYGVTA